MSTRTTDVVEVIQKLGDAQKNMHSKHLSELAEAKEARAGLQKELEFQRDRIEELESRAKLPGMAHGGAGRKVKNYLQYETSQGPIFELPSATKMADVLPPEKQPEISFSRWLAAALIGERCGDKLAVEFAVEKKQMVTSTSGILIPTDFASEWIDLVRSQMVLISAGLTTVVMDSKTLAASALVTDPAATWHTEAGSINVGNPSFAARNLTAKTLVTRCTASLEVSQDSPDFGSQLATAMARSMAAELDRAGLIGTGAPEPQGILGTSGIKQVSSVGSISDYTDLLLGVRKLLESNISLEQATKFAIMSPSVWATFEGLATGIASDKTQLQRPKSLEAMSFLSTTHGLDTGSPLTSTIFLGDFRDLVLGMRREASVEALKLSTYGTNLLLEFVGYLRADYLLRRPASFCTLEGVSTS